MKNETPLQYHVRAWNRYSVASEKSFRRTIELWSLNTSKVRDVKPGMGIDGLLHAFTLAWFMKRRYPPVVSNRYLASIPLISFPTSNRVGSTLGCRPPSAAQVSEQVTVIKAPFWPFFLCFRCRWMEARLNALDDVVLNDVAACAFSRVFFFHSPRFSCVFLGPLDS